MMHESELRKSRVCPWRHICRTARTTARDTFLVGLIAVIGTVDYTRAHLSECVQHMYRACKYYDGFEMLMTEAGRIGVFFEKEASTADATDEFHHSQSHSFNAISYSVFTD